jgi:hypothetical protein
MDDFTKKYEDAVNRILPGLQMFVRDTFLPGETEAKYQAGNIIRDTSYCDASCRVGGLATTHRFAILSNHYIDLNEFEHGTNWGLFVCKRNSHFKILDVYKLEGKTQITLLHLDRDWRLFENTLSNVADEIVQMSRERFQKKYALPPVPELATREWLERLQYPLGLDGNNEYYPLVAEPFNDDGSEAAANIRAMDSVLEKLSAAQQRR